MVVGNERESPGESRIKPLQATCVFELQWEVKMAQMKSIKAKFRKHPDYKGPREIYDIEARRISGSPRRIAETFLKRVAKEIGIKKDLSDLHFDKVKPSILGKHVFFQQYYNKEPISGGWIKVDIDKDSKVFNVLNDLVPTTALKKMGKVGKTRKVGDKDAISAALQAIGGDKRGKKDIEIAGCEKCFYPAAGTVTPAWKITIRMRKPAEEWLIYVDADDGSVLSKESILKRATAQGRVFDPNPVVTLNDTLLADTSPIPNTAYFEIELKRLDGNGMLDGDFVSTRPTSNRVQSANGKFLFKRGQKAFNEVMVYYHIDRVQHYIQQLGFDNINNRQIEVDVNGTTDDNSFYSPTTKSLTFGTGGVDDAEDADIILHEYGHSIQDDQVPGFGPSGEARAMGEGFGDYLAGSYFADLKSDKLRPCVGSWDATSYSGDDPPNLRRLDSNKRYPKDIVGEEHDDGEIWSACLWELRSAVGRRTGDILVLAHHFQISRSASFEDAANALILVDKQLNSGANETEIRDIYVRRGIFPNPKRKNRRAGETLYRKK